MLCPSRAFGYGSSSGSGYSSGSGSSSGSGGTGSGGTGGTGTGGGTGGGGNNGGGNTGGVGSLGTVTTPFGDAASSGSGSGDGQYNAHTWGSYGGGSSTTYTQSWYYGGSSGNGSGSGSGSGYGSGGGSGSGGGWYTQTYTYGTGGSGPSTYDNWSSGGPGFDPFKYVAHGYYGGGPAGVGGGTTLGHATPIGYTTPHWPDQASGLGGILYGYPGHDIEVKESYGLANSTALYELRMRMDDFGDTIVTDQAGFDDPDAQANHAAREGTTTYEGGGSATGSGNGAAAPTDSRSPINTIPDIFDAVHFEINATTIKAFFGGMLKGFFSDGAGGIVDAVKGVGSFIGGYANFALQYWRHGFGAAAKTRVGQTIDSTATMALQYGPEVARILDELRTGNLSDQTKELLGAIKPLVNEIAHALAEELSVMSDEGKADLLGRITGAVLFEVALAAGTAGAATALSAAAKGGKLANIVSKFSETLGPKIARAIETFVKKLDKAPDSVTQTAPWQILNNLGCFVAGTPVWINCTHSDVQVKSIRSTAEGANFASVAIVAEPVTSTTMPIEDVRIGWRVPASNPRPADVDNALGEPDEATWSLVQLTARHNDGSVVDMELLRPNWWVAGNGLHAGRSIAMSIPELGLSGTATIRRVCPCPCLMEGDGAVVTGRFVTRHTVNLVDVRFEGDVSVRGTQRHPVWSEDRQDWVGLGELAVGEAVRGREGRVRVTSVTPLATAERVFNIETSGEHVYEVSEAGILVHNADPDCELYQALLAKGLHNLNEAEKADFDRLYDKLASNAKSATQGITFPEWKAGGSITQALPDGSYPKWFSNVASEKSHTIQGRYWMNRATEAKEGEFTQRQLRDMSRGFAPQIKVQIKNLKSGLTEEKWISKEIHHNLGNRGVPGFDEPLHLREVWPWQHEMIDSFRRTGYEFLKFLD